MKDPYDKELRTLFSGDSEALVDEAFVQRCVTSIRRAERRLLLVKLIIICAAAGIVRLALPWLADSAAVVSSWLSPAFTAIDSGIGRAVLIGVVLVLIVWRFGLPSFRLRETRP